MERSLARPTIALPRFRPLGAVAGLLHRPRVLLWRHRPVRLTLLALLIALPLLAGGWLLFRHSSFVAVQRVQITRCARCRGRADRSGPDGGRPTHEHARSPPAALQAAVARYQVVRSVRAYPSFPHGLRLQVVEQLPVAALLVDGSRTAVAADGVVLGPTLLSGTLPTVGSDIEPAQGRLAGGAGVRGGADDPGGGSRAAGAARQARLPRPRGPHRADAKRTARVLRRRQPSAREVAVARAGARRSELRRSLRHRRPPARPPGRRLRRRGRPDDGRRGRREHLLELHGHERRRIHGRRPRRQPERRRGHPGERDEHAEHAGESPGSGTSTTGASQSAPSSAAGPAAQTGGAATAPEAGPPSSTAGTPAGGTEASSTPAGQPAGTVNLDYRLILRGAILREWWRLARSATNPCESGRGR